MNTPEKINIRMTPDEIALVDRKAAAAGKLRAPWARKMLLQAATSAENEPSVLEAAIAVLRNQNEELRKQLEVNNQMMVRLMSEAIHAKQLSLGWSALFQDGTGAQEMTKEAQRRAHQELQEALSVLERK